MNIREWLNRRPWMAAGASSLLIVVAISAAIWNIADTGGRPLVQTRAYFTIDDGAHWFADTLDKIYPFEQDGKPAVRAYVFKCGDSGKPFVAYLERFDADAIAALKKLRPGSEAFETEKTRARFSGMEVKRPNDATAKWERMNSPQGQGVTALKCLEGESGNLSPVIP